MLGPIGNDILDIGSRKAAMALEAARAADPMGLGRPGQFEVPNVTDVSYVMLSYLPTTSVLICLFFCNLCIFLYTHNFISLFF